MEIPKAILVYELTSAGVMSVPKTLVSSKIVCIFRVENRFGFLCAQVRRLGCMLHVSAYQNGVHSCYNGEKRPVWIRHGAYLLNSHALRPKILASSIKSLSHGKNRWWGIPWSDMSTTSCLAGQGPEDCCKASGKRAQQGTQVRHVTARKNARFKIDPSGLSHSPEHSDSFETQQPRIMEAHTFLDEPSFLPILRTLANNLWKMAVRRFVFPVLQTASTLDMIIDVILMDGDGQLYLQACSTDRNVCMHLSI